MSRSQAIRPHARTGRVSAALLVATFALLGLPPKGAQAAPGAPATATTVSVDPAVVSSPGDVLVLVAPEAAVAAQRAVTAAGGLVEQELPLVDGFAARLDAASLAALVEVPGVRRVLADTAVTLAATATSSTTPADSKFVENIRAHELHRKGITGKGVGIAILDTGVTEVADLAGRVVGAVDLAGDLDHTDHIGHGTFIAGIAAGSGASSKGEHAGVAPGAHVIPVKITGLDGATDVTHVLAGIQYAVSFKDDYGIRVMNLSFGTTSGESWLLDIMNFAVQRAWDAGLVVVVSGANLGPDASTIPKPADDPLVITVGAVDSKATGKKSDDTMTSFSSRGPTVSGGIAKPDVVAPGVSLVGLRAPGSEADTSHPEARVGDAYFRGTGTSFSAAVVSGAAALLAQAHPTWTPDQIKGALLSTAARGPVGDRNVDGHGSVDVAAANALLVPPLANVGVARSTGVGLLDAARGGMNVEISVPSLLGTVLKLVSGEMTAQDLLFDRFAYTTLEWTKASWYKASWYKASWYKASWYDADWYKASWYKASWYWYGY